MAKTGTDDDRKPPPFKKDSADFRRLLRLFRSGKIKATDKPSSVKERFHQHFGKYASNAFRSQFHNAKSIAGGHVAATVVDSDVSDLEDDPSVATQPTVVTPPTVAAASYAGKQEYDAMTPSLRSKVDQATMVNPDTEIHCWTPRKIMFSYRNDDGDRCVTCLFSLQHGDPHEDDGSGVDIRITQDGWVLELAEKWDEFMTDGKLFYHKFPKDPHETEEEFQKRRFAMMECTRVMKVNHMDDCLKSEFRYQLPFKVDPMMKRVTFTNTVRGRIAHVDLKENLVKKKVVTERCIDLTGDDEPPADVKRARKPNPKYAA